MKIIYTFIVAAVLISCDKTKKDTENTIETTEVTTNAVIPDLVITDNENNEGIKIEKGVIYYASEEAGTISNNYEVKDPEGKIVATYRNDSLVIAGNPGLNVPINAQGEINLDGAKVAWDKDGKLWKDKVMSEYKKTPANADSNLAASIAFYLYFNLTAPIEEE